MEMATSLNLETLRHLLNQEAPFQSRPTSRQTGLKALDGLLSRTHDGDGGLPRGALTVLSGSPGSGRSTLAAHILAGECRAGRPVAWLDARRVLYPPALQQAGVELERCLVVRSSPERAIYAAEQILTSGVFRFVVMGGLDDQLHPSRARRLLTAAEIGGTSGILLLNPASSTRVTAASLELHITRRSMGLMVTLVRHRLGPSGRKAFVALERPDVSSAA